MWLASRWRPRFLFDKRAAIEILDYGKYIVGGSILNIAFLYIDNAFVGRLVGVTALGFYTFAFSLANLPTQTITPTINKVAFPVYVKLRESQADLASAYLRSLKLVSMITFPASLGLAAVSSDLLQVLYADKWNPSISLVQLLSIYAVFRSIGALPSSVLLTIGKQALIPRLMLIYLGITALLLWPATTWFGLPGTGVVMTGVMGVGSMVWLGLANRYLAIPLKRFSKSIAPQLVASAIMVGWLVTLGTVTEESFLTLSILISTGALLYLLSILLLTKGEAYQEIVAVVKALLNPLDWLSQTPK
jgi:O-antigen/teichoic acid export membrane protein